MTKKAISNEAIDTAVELTQKTASLTLKSAVQAAEVTEGYVQGMYKAGYDANVDALKVAKGYWDATSQIRQDWLRLFASTGESFINSAAKMELPLQKEVMDFGKNVLANVEKTVENMTAQAKSAANGK
ncbi:MAG TPA: hypothetical protein VIL74_12530 [Pyrinomonadaceae bacterium]|jgi:hypothetical protein